MKLTKIGAIHGRAACEQITVPVNRLPESFDGFRIAHVSDVHLAERGGDTSGIIALSARQKPDIIVTTGDLIENYADVEASGLAELYAGLAAICPVYAVTGNHELRGADGEYWPGALEGFGVTALDGRWTVLDRNGGRVALMGLGGNTPLSPEAMPDMDPIRDMPRLLLMHRPEYIRSCAVAATGMRPDVVFSGHAHGGQVRLPLLDGLYAPGQGILPRYTSGLYDVEGISLIVSRGLCDPLFPPRINNKPHMPVVTLRRG